MDDKLGKDLSDVLEKIELLKNEVEKMKSEFNNRFFQLDTRVQSLMESKIHKLNNENEHNARGAGRKRKITNEVIQKVKKYRGDKKSFDEIALLMGLSVGTVHKASKMEAKENGEDEIYIWDVYSGL